MQREQGKDDSLTIVFVHRGNPFYLKYAIGQAVHTQGGSRVVLLGDEANKGLGLCEWYPLEDFGERACDFARRYKHLSPNDYDFELFCIQRWLYLSEFVAKAGIGGNICYLDSDALVYFPLRERFAEQQFGIALTRGIGPAFTLIRNASVLYRLADFIEAAYEPGEMLETLKYIYATGDSPFWLKSGYVSDMQLLGFFALAEGGAVDLESPWNGWVYDYGFGERTDYRHNPYKNIKWLGRDIKGYYGLKNGERHYFAGIHFQVGAKIFMPQYYTGRAKFGDRYYYKYIKWRGRATTAAKWVLRKLGLFHT